MVGHPLFNHNLTKMKKIFVIIGIISCLVFVTSCGRDPKAFAGTFTDEFGNKFVLNEDSTATIQFAGFDAVEQSHWHIIYGANDSVYAGIYFNGDPEYYYLYNNKMYHHLKDLVEDRSAIKIQYE